MKRILFILISIVIIVPDLSAQTSQTLSSSLGMYVFPAKDQTKEVQDADEAACYKWAKEQSGVDPLNPPKVEVKQTETGPDGSAVRGAARGAAAGAAIGAITGDAGEGAAVGAVVGGLAGRRARIAGDQAEQQQNTQAAAAQEKAMIDNFKKAFTACMEGKGYTVK